ncbi:MAG: hypothetical protein HC877_13775 [Thioploca sp.]|nr:hypothetical protein [Thioploca sp.]
MKRGNQVNEAGVRSHLNPKCVLQLINTSTGKPYESHLAVEAACLSGIGYAYLSFTSRPRAEITIEEVKGSFRPYETEGFANASAIAVLTGLGEPITSLVAPDGIWLIDSYSGQWQMILLEKT